MDVTISYAPYTDALGSPLPLEACGAAANTSSSLLTTLTTAPHFFRTIFSTTLASPVKPLAAFQPLNVGTYYKGSLLSRAVPYLAFTSVVLVTFFSFLTWRVTTAACCCRRGRRRAARWAGLDGASAAAAAPRRVLGGQLHKALVGFSVITVAMAVAAAAYSMSQAEPRALDTSLAALQGDEPTAVRGLLSVASAQLTGLGSVLSDAARAVDAMQASAAATADSAGASDPATAAAASQVATQAASLSADLQAAVDEVASVSNTLDTSVVGALDTAVEDYLPLARKVDTGRLGVTYGLFALLILTLLCSLLAGCTGVPAGLATALGCSLFLAAFLAILAIPLLGVTLAARADACSYTEPLILAVASRTDGAAGVAAPILATIFYGPSAGQDLRDWQALQGGGGGGSGGPLVASAAPLAKALLAWTDSNTTTATRRRAAAAASLADQTQDALGLGLTDLATAADAAGADLLEFATFYNETVAAAPADAAAFQAAVVAASAALNATADRITALDTTLSPASLRAVYLRVKGVLCCVIADGVGDLWWGTALSAGLTLVAGVPLSIILGRLDGLPPLARTLAGGGRHRSRRCTCCCGSEGWARRRAGEADEVVEGLGPQPLPSPPPRGVPAGALTAAGYTAAVALPPPSPSPPASSSLISPQGSGVPLVRGGAPPSAPPLTGGSAGGSSPITVPPAAWPVRPAGHSSAPPPHWAKYPKI